MSIWHRIVAFVKNTGVVKVILLAIACTGVLVYFIGASIKGGDFVTFLEASSKMWHGTNIYDPPYINLRYSYSPFWAMILVPLALLPHGVGPFIWLLISLFILWRTIFLLRSYYPISIKRNNRSDIMLWIIILLYMSRYIELNFHHVQVTVFLLWLMLEGGILAEKNKEVLAGVFIGIGSIIKIMPIVMVPYFIYRKRLIAALSSVSTIIAAFFLPALFVGKERLVELNHSWFSILRPDNPEFQIDGTWHFPQNLSAFLYRLFVDTGAPYSHNILDLTYTQADKWIWIIIFVLILITLYFLGSLPFQRSKSRLHQLYELSYIMLLIPLIFPHQMKYAFYFVFPAICCICFIAVNNFQNRDFRYYMTLTLLILSFILCTMTTDLIIGMKYSTISQHLKTITIGTLLLIPALALNGSFFKDNLQN